MLTVEASTTLPMMLQIAHVTHDVNDTVPSVGSQHQTQQDRDMLCPPLQMIYAAEVQSREHSEVGGSDECVIFMHLDIRREHHTLSVYRFLVRLEYQIRADLDLLRQLRSIA